MYSKQLSTDCTLWTERFDQVAATLDIILMKLLLTHCIESHSSHWLGVECRVCSQRNYLHQSASLQCTNPKL